MSSIEIELQTVIAANLDALPRTLVADEDDEHEDVSVMIYDVLGDFSEQTGALFG